MVDNRRRTVTLPLRPGRGAAPDFFAGQAVECNNVRALTPGQRQQVITIDERVGRVSPQWSRGTVFLFQVMRPHNFPAVRAEAEQVPLSTQRVNQTLMHDRCATRTCRIGN